MKIYLSSLVIKNKPRATHVVSGPTQLEHPGHTPSLCLTNKPSQVPLLPRPHSPLPHFLPLTHGAPEVLSERWQSDVINIFGEMLIVEKILEPAEEGSSIERKLL